MARVVNNLYVPSKGKKLTPLQQEWNVEMKKLSRRMRMAQQRGGTFAAKAGGLATLGKERVVEAKVVPQARESRGVDRRALEAVKAMRGKKLAEKANVPQKQMPGAMTRGQMQSSKRRYESKAAKAATISTKGLGKSLKPAKEKAEQGERQYPGAYGKRELQRQKKAYSQRPRVEVRDKRYVALHGAELTAEQKAWNEELSRLNTRMRGFEKKGYWFLNKDGSPVPGMVVGIDADQADKIGKGFGRIEGADFIPTPAVSGPTKAEFAAVKALKAGALAAHGEKYLYDTDEVLPGKEAFEQERRDAGVKAAATRMGKQDTFFATSYTQEIIARFDDMLDVYEGLPNYELITQVFAEMREELGDEEYSYLIEGLAEDDLLPSAGDFYDSDPKDTGAYTPRVLRELEKKKRITREQRVAFENRANELQGFVASDD